MSELRNTLREVCERGATLTREAARQALVTMLSAETESAATDVEIASLLTAFATRGETVDELTGFAEAMRSLAEPVPLTPGERAQLVDTCGTGGDGQGTFNISTGAALVAAAAGAMVAKHGNRGVTSRCGSADVLEALGVPVALTPRQSVDCLRATGFMFLYAPALHPSMKRVQPVRRALGFRTIFNLAGPLTNPAHAPAQVMGVFDGERVPLVAEAMARLGIRHAYVVHGSDGLDELTLSGESRVARVERLARAERAALSLPHASSHPAPLIGETHQTPDRAGDPANDVENDRAYVRLFTLTPEDAGLPRAPLSALQGGDTAEANAAILEKIFAGGTGPHHDPQRDPKRAIVLLNAAAALVAAGLAADFKEGVLRGAEAIDSGAARATLEKLRKFARSLTGT